MILVATFIGLGKWQLDRATQLKSKEVSAKVVDQNTYQLSAIARPTDTLVETQVNKSVITKGHYTLSYRAPNQVDARGARSDWEVALLEIDGDKGILVVRGLWADATKQPQLPMSTEVTVTGWLQPHQNDDVAESAPSVLSRIDSALLTSQTDLELYDGYIVAAAEQTRDGAIERSRIAPSIKMATVPGFYWQHISYVVIWWLMALVVLYLPFYNYRLRRRV